MSSQKLRVLLVEDNEIDQMAFQRFAKREGLPFDFVIASSINQAHQFLEGEKYDALLLDYRLGDGTAFDLFDVAKQLESPIIIITGTGDQEISVQAMKKGAYDYIIKDNDGNYLKTLPLTVENVIRRKRAELEVIQYQTHLEEMVRDRTIELQAEIMERKQVEKELEKYRDHLEELVEKRTHELQEANDELKFFAYSVSHDLKALIRSLHGFSLILLAEYAERLEKTGCDYLQRIVEAVKGMDAFIEDLLSYSHLSRTEIEFIFVSLEEAVEMVLARLDEEIQKKQAQIAILTPLPYVVGQQTILEQIILNLMSNALKFVPPDTPPYIKIWCTETADKVKLFIQDNGIGIAPEYHDRIFQAFQRIHSSKQYIGTGIGLAIVRKGVRRLGGEVGVKSEVNKGSTFWIELRKVAGH
ncbi:response regulator [candidate division KSB1 bacterium]|nr:response regulator [candidate division KSB1 bacterium]